MPFVRVDLAEGKSVEYRQAVSDGIQQALIAALAIPTDDLFQLITEHPQHEMVYDPGYLGISRDDDLIFIQITLRVGRTVAQKKALYQELSTRLAASPGLKPANIFVMLHEIALENWSFGEGLAQYA
jgi:phenylpyruvate tautomerase PptA (4-oxalocrotonate tautomerase family)